ncbi:cytochrome P450 [Bimuria novae-zelandiae CBS 107.79]|uniref:Cytochrome P450 n=1 Tax=Bimuria novae-zelandiae CBS 107.79 TaxID=1447943 RepID=A0A6A5VSB6_9PLEO|nr:cytochrome P450 [Bimuria novae-zelandiae CBS 107.79]
MGPLGGEAGYGCYTPFECFSVAGFVPSVLTPWPGWKNKSVELGRAQRALYEELLGKARERIKSGVRDSFMKGLLERKEKEGFSELDVVYLRRGGGLMEAGADTTAVALLVFILAMAAHGDVQRRAQEEVDAVFGNEMPSKVERRDLPYVRAVFWEVLRWRPSFPLTLPHATSKDDIYNGYFIPARSTVIMNT